MLCGQNSRNCQLLVSIFKLVFSLYVFESNTPMIVKPLHFSLIQIYFPLFLGTVMFDNKFKTKENKVLSEDKILFVFIAKC